MSKRSRAQAEGVLTRCAAVLALLAVLSPISLAKATPSDAVLSSSSDQVLWTGGPLRGSTVVASAPELCAVERCDEHTLTLSLPQGTFGSGGGVQVSIRWGDSEQDLDLYVYGPDGALGAKSDGIKSAAESVLLDAPSNGDYRVLVVPKLADDLTYEASAEVEYAPAQEPVRDLLPDLVSLPPRNLHFETSAYFFDLSVPSIPGGCYPEEIVEQGARRCLRFDQTIANLGSGPFEVRYRLETLATTQALVQRIYRSDGSFYDRFADTYTFHPAHAHFHYANFAQSHLWASNAGGVKLGTAPVRTAHKNGFCMIDVEQTWFARRGDAPRSYVPPGCLAPSVVDPATGEVSAISGISAGWADVYWWYLADQFIEVTGLQDGYYLLENIADQAGTVKEVDDSNNAAHTLIRICGDQAEIVGVEHRCPGHGAGYQRRSSKKKQKEGGR